MLRDNITLNTQEYNHIPWTERMDFFKKLGFQSLELDTLPLSSEKEFEDFKAFVRQHEMKVVSTCDWYHFFEPNDKEGIERVQERFLLNLERTRAYGADRLIWYTGDNDRYESEAAVEALVARLEPILKRAKDLDVLVLLETEFSQKGLDPGSSAALLESLMKKANHSHLGINFDAANVYVAGEEPYPYAYERLRPWIRHVHLKDIYLHQPGFHPALGEGDKPQEGNGRTGICCPLGEGAVNMLGWLKALASDEYHGCLALELHVRKELLNETLDKGIAFLKAHWPGTNV